MSTTLADYEIYLWNAWGACVAQLRVYTTTEPRVRQHAQHQMIVHVPRAASASWHRYRRDGVLSEELGRVRV